MPEIETPHELADDIANQIGVYCDHPEEGYADHEGGNMCRIDFVIDMTNRIRKAAQHERQLEPKPENALHLRVEVVEAGEDPDGGLPRVVLKGGKDVAKAFARHMYRKLNVWIGA